MPLIRARPKADHGYCCVSLPSSKLARNGADSQRSGLSQTEKETSLWF